MIHVAVYCNISQLNVSFNTQHWDALVSLCETCLGYWWILGFGIVSIFGKLGSQWDWTPGSRLDLVKASLKVVVVVVVVVDTIPSYSDRSSPSYRTDRSPGPHVGFMRGASLRRWSQCLRCTGVDVPRATIAMNGATACCLVSVCWHLRPFSAFWVV